MKLAQVFAIAALGASAASAAEPSSVVGVWSPQKLRDVGGLPTLQFTTDGRVFALYGVSVVQFSVPLGPPAAALPRPPRELLGRYEFRDDKVMIRLGPGGSSAFELTKDGRLCVFPGPGVLNGVFRPTGGERQCYQRLNVERS